MRAKFPSLAHELESVVLRCQLTCPDLGEKPTFIIILGTVITVVVVLIYENPTWSADRNDLAFVRKQI